MISMLFQKIPPDPIGPLSQKPLSDSSNFLCDWLKCVVLLLSMLLNFIRSRPKNISLSFVSEDEYYK